MIFAIGYIVVVTAVLSYLAVHGMLKKESIETTGLNMLGDFAAGFFAPLAFIGLAGAFYLQHQQLVLAKAQNDANEIRHSQQLVSEQNAARLNYASIQANYKLSLYGLRKEVFDELTKASELFDAEISDDMLEALRKALTSAQFVFPKEVETWILEMLETAASLRMKQRFAATGQRKIDVGGKLTEYENRQLGNAYDEISRLQLILHTGLLSEPLFKRFEPYMRLPTQIEYEKVKAVEV